MLQANRVSVYDHNDNNKKKNGWTSGKTKIELKSNINPIYGIDYLTGSKIYLCIVGIVSCFVNYMQVMLPLFIYFFFVQSDYLIIYFFSFISIISRWSWLPFNDNDYIDPKRLSLDNDNINRTYTHTHSLIVKDCKLVDYHHHYHI